MLFNISSKDINGLTRTATFTFSDSSSDIFSPVNSNHSNHENVFSSLPIVQLSQKSSSFRAIQMTFPWT